MAIRPPSPPNLIASATLQPPYRVRSAGPRDLNQLADILTSSFYPPLGWRRWIYPVLRFGIYEDLKQRFQSAPSYYACLTAVVSSGQSQEDWLVGTVEIAPRRRGVWSIGNPRQLYLSNLAVRQRYRRRGVAAQLLQACEQTAQSWGFRELYLHVMEDNARARQVYHRAGYETYRAEVTLMSLVGAHPKKLLLRKVLGQA